jgi:uncharacterized protein YndB with AHSA1/START domain
MPAFRAESFINAPPSAVWKILADLPAYSQWCPFTESMHSPSTTFTLGETIVEQVRLAPSDTSRRETHVRVVELGEHTVAWTSVVLHPSVIFARRVQRVTRAVDARGAEGCIYFTEDTINGCASPLVELLYGGQLRAGLQSVADALKARAEAA